MMFWKRFFAFFVCLLLLAGSFLFQAGAADDPVLSADFEEASGFDTVAGTFSLPGGSVRIFNDGFYRAETDENHGRYMIWECETPGKNTYVPVTLTVRPTVDYVLSLDFRYEELAEVKAGQCTLNLIQLYSLSQEICRKWNIPLLDWYSDPNINVIILSVDTDAYLEDGLYPNSQGYDRLTPYVERFLADLIPYSSTQQPGPDQEETTAGADTGTQPVPVPSGESTDDASADPVDSDGCASAAGVLWLFPAVAVAAPLLFFRRSYHRCGGHRRMVCLLLLSGLVVLPSCAGAQNGQTNTRPPENFTDGQSEGSQKTEEPAEPDGGIMLSEEIVDGDLRIYPVPDSYRRSDTAVITVNGHAAPLVYIGSVYDPLSNYDTCSFAAGIDAPVILEITVQADIQEYEISCQSTEPRAEIDGRTLTIVTDGPHDMIVRIDNLREIVICADPPETDVPPPEGDGIYNVATQYGADTRGRELATAAFYKAIRDAAGAGGGIVYVPDGVYLLSNLILQSNVSLYLESGAYLMCTEDTAVLTESERKTTEHGHTVDYPISWMFTTASGSENIRIFGRGTIDGQGALMKLKHGWLINLIRTNITSDFTLEGVTLRDSSHWGCIIYQSTRVDIRGTKHLNLVKNLNEDDGIDVCSSREVEVLDTVVIAQDDPYSVKSYAIAETSDVRFEDGLTWTRCAAAKAGYGHVTNVSNIVFRGITAHRCMFGVNITQYQGRADTTGVTFEDITINGFTRLSDHDPASWIFIDYKDSSVGGNVRDVTVSDIHIRSLELMDGYSGLADKIPCGTRCRLVWLTFDRHNGSAWNWSYGNLYVYDSGTYPPIGK